MTQNEMIFEMMKSIAPVVVQEGLKLQKSIVDAGGNPEDCKVDGMSITEAYAKSARIWAETFVNALNH